MIDKKSKRIRLKKRRFGIKAFLENADKKHIPK
jgi:hypothetical protein